ncbi:MAG: ribosome assembly factor SBDS [Candidatus Nanoarchaeia archaeon]|nr:ribosome assembly factor SBDS [Candidatus Nanoarchaeia archaeon]
MVKGNMLIDDRKQIAINVVKIKTHGKYFEVAIDPDKTVEYKEGKEIPMSEIVQAEHIFTDMKKGLFASPEDLEEAFGTSDALKVTKIMLDKGEIQFTHAYRQKLHDQKFRKIVTTIHRMAIDPRTNLPHPINRIEAALEEAKIKIDDAKSADKQIKEIVIKLQPIIPLSIEEFSYSIHVPVHYAKNIQKVLKAEATILNEKWLGESGAIFNIKVPAGRSRDLMEQLNSQTHASVQIDKI